MDRMTFGKKTLNAKRPRTDRFVAPRELFPEYRRRIFWGTRFEQHQNNGEIWYSKYLKQKKYRNYMDEAFDLEPLTMQESKDAEPGKNLGQTWPCVPRKKSYLSSADSVLDLPSYNDAAFPELLDWSNDNILVAALGRNYHKWSWRTQSLISQGFTQNEIQCCKFDPRGELLLLGTNPKTVEIHDNAVSKCLDITNCRCYLDEDQKICSITAIDWSPTGNSFVTGCSRGVLCAVTRQSQVIRRRRGIPGTIFAVRVSPDARYVAAANVNGNAVLVLSWPDLELYSNLSTESLIIKTLNWHPWRSALLGIGTIKTNFRTRIALWDAPSGRVRESGLGHGAHSMDCMLFSHRTGELVVSLWKLDVIHPITSPKMCSQLLVMSDFDTVVDHWGQGRTGLDRIRTMVFSPDGTKLATATEDEDLIIWNFLPEDNIKKKKICRRFSAMPEYLDITSHGFSLR